VRYVLSFLDILQILSHLRLHTVRASDLRTREKLVRNLLRTFRTLLLRCFDTEVHSVYCHTDLSVGVQTTARAPFVLSVSGIHGGEGWRFGTKAKESLIRES